MERQQGLTTEPPRAACPPHDTVSGSASEREPSVGDRYLVEALLGRGGMADVYRGQDTRLRRPVAIKRMRSDLAANPTLRVRFRREASSVAQLDHPSIVAVYDSGCVVESGVAVSVPFIVMELVEGQSLLELLHQRQSLTPQSALTITAAVLDALAYSHACGVIHRDIKPANVMVTSGGRVKVTDFGIARILPDGSATATQPGAVMGTPFYMSPEQLRGEATDARSDIYSVGCLLFQLLTGRPPFVGDSPLSIACQHVTEAPPAPSGHKTNLPTAIDAVVAKALAKAPQERYQTAASMRADIDAILDTLTDTAAERLRHDLASPTDLPTPRQLRQPVPRLLVGAFVFALLTCALGLVVDPGGRRDSLSPPLIAASISRRQPSLHATKTHSAGDQPAAIDNFRSSQGLEASRGPTSELRPVDTRPTSRAPARSARHDQSETSKNKLKQHGSGPAETSQKVKINKQTGHAEVKTKGKAPGKKGPAHLRGT